MVTAFSLTHGDNITLTVSIDNKDEVTRIFNELKDGGEVYMGLGQTFFSIINCRILANKSNMQYG